MIERGDPEKMNEKSFIADGLTREEVLMSCLTAMRDQPGDGEEQTVKERVLELQE